MCARKKSPLTVTENVWTRLGLLVFKLILGNANLLKYWLQVVSTATGGHMLHSFMAACRWARVGMGTLCLPACLALGCKGRDEEKITMCIHHHQHHHSALLLAKKLTIDRSCHIVHLTHRN